MAKIKNTDNTNVNDNAKQLKFSDTAGGKQNGIITLENSLTVTYKVKHILTYDPGISFPGIYSRKTKAHAHKILYTNVYSSSIYNCQKLEIIQMSPNRWIGKETTVHPHNGILHNSKKDWTIATTTYMNLKGIMSNKRSQSEKVVYCMIPFILQSQNHKTIEMKKR